MLFDVAAWVVILLVAWALGGGILALLRVHGLRSGDAYMIRAWMGVIALSLALLALSIALPLTPITAGVLAVTLAALGAGASRLYRRGPGDTPRLRGMASASIGVMLLLVGAAALTSDAVTLYDSLVYHVGIIRWLSEHGTVPGLALIHNRLGHVSAWFALAAPFDHGIVSNRSATVPLGVALVLIGLQSAIAVGRVVAGRAWVSDWFFVLLASAFLWAVVARGAATPSPDVATNVLIAVAAWSILVVSHNDGLDRGAEVEPGRASIPLIFALGAASMKLFAVPAVVVTATLFVTWTRRDSGTRSFARPTITALLVSASALGPFIAANFVASGCPLYPSPVGCARVGWAYGAAQAADYADYIRDVARWDRRGNTPPDDTIRWIIPWVRAHPVVTLLAVLSAAIGTVMRRGVRRHERSSRQRSRESGLNGVVTLALVGIVFAFWQAPAPRFLYAVALMTPALAGAFALCTLSDRSGMLRASTSASPRRFMAGFMLACVVVGFTYGIASQKLNVRSAVVSGAPLVRAASGDLLVPAAPERQSTLFRWRVNDLDLFTPVPLPIADTLSYHSVIAHNADFEKCSTAPLPCTPYLPPRQVRLRRPSRGIAGGFTRVSEPDLGGAVATCLGMLRREDDGDRGLRDATSRSHDASGCQPLRGR